MFHVRLHQHLIYRPFFVTFPSLVEPLSSNYICIYYNVIYYKLILEDYFICKTISPNNNNNNNNKF